MGTPDQEIFLRYPDFKTKAVTMSYDDGVVQDRRLVDAMNRNGLKGTFNLNSGLFGTGNHLPAGELPALYRGHETAVHTLTHPHLNNLSTAQIAVQVLRDRENLESLFGTLVEGMAYPFGLTETPYQVRTLADCGIRYARTTVTTEAFGLPEDPLRWNPTCHHANPNLPKLLESFLQPDDLAHPWRITAKLFYVWGHSYEFDGKWDEMENLCRNLGGHAEVWYATNGQIIDYLEAYRRLRRSADGSIVLNPTHIRLWLSVCGENRILEPGQAMTV